MGSAQNIINLTSILHTDPVQIEKLMAFCKAPIDDLEIIERNVGGNNIVLKVSISGRFYALKKYNTSKFDNRNRLKAEWDFISLVKNVDSNSPIPTPYALNEDASMAIYEFIEGNRISSDTITASNISSAIQFIKTLNTPLMQDSAAHLPIASDAKFSINDHIDFVRDKITELQLIEDQDTASTDLLTDMAASLMQIETKIIPMVTDEGFKTDEALPQKERCLSPSDFGFHNTIKTKSGSLVFIDFEYAGWDDPAKLSADFFFQPQIPVPQEYYDQFLASCLSYLNKDRLQVHITRAKFLRPLFGLRWCCILLNPLKLDWAKARGLDQDIQKYKATCRDRIKAARLILLRWNEDFN